MFKLLKKIKDFISGYKTYFVAGVAIITAVIAWAEGAITLVELIKTIGAAIGAITLRAGMKTSTPA